MSGSVRRFLPPGSCRPPVGGEIQGGKVRKLVLRLTLTLTLALGAAIVGATSASAASACSGKTNVGHGIYLSACAHTASGKVDMAGTTVWFTSNPLLVNCVIVTRIRDFNTGGDVIGPSGNSGPACTLNADQHKTWVPGTTVMASESCVSGHTYYAFADIDAIQANGDEWFTQTAIGGPVTC